MRLRRREFILTGAGAGIASLAGGCGGFPAIVSSRSPNSRLKHACIGTANMAWSDIKSFQGHPNVDIVALCDVDAAFLGKASRELCPKARGYRDWRELLEKEDIDSLNVSTPDHTHAIIAVNAMKKGVHCYCQKPLCHDIRELELMRETAAKLGVVTQFGAQFAARPGDRSVVELLHSGELGPVRRVWMFSNRGGKSKKKRFSMPTAPVPQNLDWDGWLGPAPFRPYAEKVFHPLLWRTWHDYGSSVVGDMASHMFSSLWLGMNLKATRAKTVVAEVDDAFFNDSVYREGRFPTAAHVSWDFGSFSVDWYDGERAVQGMSEKFLPPDDIVKLAREKSPFRDFFIQGKVIECEGAWIFEPHDHDLLPAVVMKDGKSAPALPKLPEAPTHFHEFFDAILEGRKTRSDFSWSTYLAEAVMMGSLAERVPGRVLKPADMRSFVPPCRKGWEFWCAKQSSAELTE